MMEKTNLVVVDSNVLIGFLDKRDKWHRKATQITNRLDPKGLKCF